MAVNSDIKFDGAQENDGAGALEKFFDPIWIRVSQGCQKVFK